MIKQGQVRHTYLCEPLNTYKTIHEITNGDLPQAKERVQGGEMDLGALKYFVCILCCIASIPSY